MSIECRGAENTAVLAWRPPNPAVNRAWNNRADATRDGAYIVSLAAIECELGLVALSRAETRTGADYYVGEARSEDLESAYRLEVSGTDAGDRRSMKHRLRKKLEQAASGHSNLPAYASVVGFREAAILIEELEK